MYNSYSCAVEQGDEDEQPHLNSLVLNQDHFRRELPGQSVSGLLVINIPELPIIHRLEVQMEQHCEQISRWQFADGPCRHVVKRIV